MLLTVKLRYINYKLYKGGGFAIDIRLSIVRLENAACMYDSLYI